MIPTTSALAAARDELRHLLAPLLPNDVLQLYLVAITEAMTNAVEAHTRAAVNEPVTVAVDLAGERVTVHDRATGIPTPTADAPRHSPTAFRERDPAVRPPSRGRGLLIMRAICPGVTIESGSDGTVVSLPYP